MHERRVIFLPHDDPAKPNNISAGNFALGSGASLANTSRRELDEVSSLNIINNTMHAYG
jgi:hypothetical protein